MVMVVAGGLRMTAGSMVVRLSLKGIAFASALNIVVKFTHPLDIRSVRESEIQRQWYIIHTH